MLVFFAAAFFLCGHVHHGLLKGEPCPVRPAPAEFGWCAVTPDTIHRCDVRSPGRIVCQHHHGHTVCEGVG